MRKPSVQRALAVFSMLLASAVLSEAQTNQTTMAGFTLRVTPGSQYNVPKTILLFIKFPVYPQIACWLETPESEYVDTIYVTESGAKNNFAFAPRNGRPEALPIWYHRKAQWPATTDAVSGATSTTAAEHKTRLSTPLKLGRYVAFLEVNRAYDYNKNYTHANSGVNGQPSLIYRAEIVVGKGPSKATFAPIGVGSVDGSDGNIRLGLGGITTALNIIENAEIEYNEK